jgi:DNA-binding response OmpR family regulator
MRVLIIDDDPDLRNLLVHYIRQQWPAGDIEEYDPLERGMPDEKYSLASYDVINGCRTSRSAATARRSSSSPGPATRASR